MIDQIDFERTIEKMDYLYSAMKTHFSEYIEGYVEELKRHAFYLDSYLPECNKYCAAFTFIAVINMIKFHNKQIDHFSFKREYYNPLVMGKSYDEINIFKSFQTSEFYNEIYRKSIILDEKKDLLKINYGEFINFNNISNKTKSIIHDNLELFYRDYNSGGLIHNLCMGAKDLIEKLKEKIKLETKNKKLLKETNQIYRELENKIHEEVKDFFIEYRSRK